jgi:hypothetical protein
LYTSILLADDKLKFKNSEISLERVTGSIEIPFRIENKLESTDYINKPNQNDIYDESLLSPNKNQFLLDTPEAKLNSSIKMYDYQPISLRQEQIEIKANSNEDG